MSQSDMPASATGKAIVKALSPMAYYSQPSEVYRLWLRYTEMILYSYPRVYGGIIHQISEHKKTHPNWELPDGLKCDVAAHPRVDEAIAIRGEILSRHNKVGMDCLEKAFWCLLDANDSQTDIVGEIYEAWAWPNSWRGQFFTPQPLCDMMALMICPDDAAMYAHIKDAAMKSMIGEAYLMSAMLLPSIEEKEPESVAGISYDLFWGRMVPAMVNVGDLEPIKIHDPCCGSGRMFLAGIKQLSPVMYRAGMVQFMGQDVDHGCVMMSRINMMMNGANGSSFMWAIDLSDEEINSLPQLFADVYGGAKREIKEMGRPANEVTDRARVEIGKRYVVPSKKK